MGSGKCVLLHSISFEMTILPWSLLCVLGHFCAEVEKGLSELGFAIPNLISIRVTLLLYWIPGKLLYEERIH